MKIYVRANGYYPPIDPVTTSKSEIEKMLEKLGFQRVSFESEWSDDDFEYIKEYRNGVTAVVDYDLNWFTMHYKGRACCFADDPDHYEASRLRRSDLSAIRRMDEVASKGRITWDEKDKCYLIYSN